jgi:hypothetical protein
MEWLPIVERHVIYSSEAVWVNINALYAFSAKEGQFPQEFFGASIRSLNLQPEVARVPRWLIVLSSSFLISGQFWRNIKGTEKEKGEEGEECQTERQASCRGGAGWQFGKVFVRSKSHFAENWVKVGARD